MPACELLYLVSVSLEAILQSDNVDQEQNWSHFKDLDVSLLTWTFVEPVHGERGLCDGVVEPVPLRQDLVWRKREKKKIKYKEL